MSSSFGSPQSNKPNQVGGQGGGFGAPGTTGTGFGSTSPGFGSTASATGFGADSSQSSGFGGSSPASSQPLVFRSGPWSWVLAAISAALIGLLLGAIAFFGPFTATDSPYLILAVVGWALAGIVTFVLLGVYLTEDTKRQAEGPYIGIPAQITTYRVAAVIGLVAVVITAVEIALAVSKAGAF